MKPPSFDEEYPLIPIERLDLSRYADEAGIFVLATRKAEKEPPVVVFVGATMESLGEAIQAALGEPRIQRHSPTLFSVRIHQGVEITDLPRALGRMQQRANELIERTSPLER
jgi:hypothetical protein